MRAPRDLGLWPVLCRSAGRILRITFNSPLELLPQLARVVSTEAALPLRCISLLVFHGPGVSYRWATIFGLPSTQ
jgi:hypothetical protein